MTRQRRSAGLVATLVAGLVGWFGLTLPASAHNALDSTAPADGQQVATAPSAVVLTFNEPAMALGTAVQVTGPGGQVQQGSAELVDNTVRQPLATGLPAGDYTVVWRVTSADGHPISGTFTFTARTGASAAASPSVSPSVSPPVAAAPSTPAAAPADPNRGRIPAWLWIVAGVVVIVFARPIAARLQRRQP